MGVVSADIAWEEEARFEQQSREWRSQYKVLMSRIDDGPKEMLAGLPRLNPYQPHPKDSDALVSEFFPRRMKGTNFWDLDIRWSTDIDVSSSPLAEPAQIDIQSVSRTIPALFDSSGNAIVNVAGDFYTEPVPERNVTDLVFRVTKNLPINLPDWVLSHPDTVNRDTLKIRGLTCDPGTLYFGGLQIGPEQNVPGATDTISTLNGKSIPFCTATFELNYRSIGWTLLVPNWGYFQLVPVKAQKAQKIEVAGGKPLRIKKIPFHYTRQRITVGPIGDYPPHPVFLDSNGAAIINPTIDQIISLEYDLHDKQTFQLLPLK